MLQINDYIIYGTTDVCQMVGIRKEILNNGGVKEYYILKPLYEGNNTIYAPVDNGRMKMRRILTIDEVYELVRTIPDGEAEWIDDDRLRKDEFSEILKNGDRSDLVQLIKTLHTKRKEQIANGKKFRSSDEIVMKAAEKLLYNEFALILGIKPDEVARYILEKISLLDQECSNNPDEKSKTLKISNLTAAACII